MATWEDGPEYAPLARPAAFTDPGLPPLAVIAPPAAPPAAPSEPPAYLPPAQPQADLATLVPPQPPARDPNAPFDTISLSLTSVPAGGSSWTPTQPLRSTAPSAPVDLARRPVVAPQAQINAPSFPAPGTPQWFAPGQPLPRQPAVVSLKDVANAVTVPVIIATALGGLINSIALPMLVLGMVATSRIAYRRRMVTGVVGSVTGVLSLVALVQIFEGADAYTFYGALCDAAQLVSWGALIALISIMYRALSLRERPERW